MILDAVRFKQDLSSPRYMENVPEFSHRTSDNYDDAHTCFPLPHLKRFQ